MKMAARVCVGVADLRSEPRFRSERVDQAIYGQEVDIIQEEGDFAKVTLPDGYTGYMLRNGLGKCSPGAEFKIVRTFEIGDLRLPVGSLLTSDDISAMEIPNSHYKPVGFSLDPLKLAEQYLGVPYLWGGVTEFGMDCSGLVQRVFSFNGKVLPRNSGDQEKVGKHVPCIEECRPGDLIFFPGHVGICKGRGLMIHANLHNQRVTVTDLFENNVYAGHLRETVTSIRRIEI